MARQRRIKFKDNREKKLRLLYQGRKDYKDNILANTIGIVQDEAVSLPPTIDLIYGRPTYGRVNFDNEPVLPREKKLANIDYSSTSNQVYCFDFVAAAFRDLNSFISKKVRSGAIVPGEIILPSGLQPTNGASSVGSMQDYLITGQLTAFNNMLSSMREPLRKKNKVKNIEHYTTKFIEFVQVNKMTMTKTAIIIGNAKGILDTGLAIDVSVKDQSDDKVKAGMVLSSKDWNFFRWAARDHGFMIDKNVPWRLVADLASPIMQEYMVRHKTSLENVFNTHFSRASAGDMASIQNIILNGYNGLVSKFSLIRDVGCKPCGTHQSHGHFDEIRNFKIKTTVRNSFRRPATQSSISTVPSGAWIALYAHIKNSEAEFLYDQTKMENIIRDAKEVMFTLDNFAAARYIEDMFKEAMLANLVTSQAPTEQQPESSNAFYVAPSAMATSSGATTGGTSTGGY